MKINKKLARIFYDIEELLRIKGTPFKPNAYKKAAETIENLKEDISEIYRKKGLNGLIELKGIGKSIAKKIEEFIKTKKIKYYKELKEETAIRQIITYYFRTKGISLEKLKRDAKKRKIIYSRYTRAAKQLLELSGSVEKAKKALEKVSIWAKSRNLDYAIETVFKKWLELEKLKPKEKVKKPYYKGKPMVWSELKKKWYVIDENGNWLEFAGKESDIEWKEK